MYFFKNNEDIVAFLRKIGFFYGTQAPLLYLPLLNGISPLIGTVTPSFTRTTSGTYFDSNLVLQTAGIGVPRFESNGYLAEKQSTNRLKSSEDLDNISNWSKTGSAAVTANQAIGPDGLTNLELLENIGSPGSVYQIAYGFGADVFVEPRFYIKKITSTGTFALNNPLSASLGQWTINLSAISSDLEMIHSSHPAVTIVNVFKANGSGQAGIQFTGSGDVDFYAGFVGEEEGGIITSYIKTTTAVITRTQDQLSYDNSGKLALPDEFTLVIDVTPKAAGSSYTDAEFVLFGSDDTGGANDEVSNDGGANYSYTALTGGGTFTLKKSDFSAEVLARVAFSLSQEGANSRAVIWKDGVEKYNNTQVQTLGHSDTTLTIGYHNTAAGAFNMKDVRIYSGKLSDIKLAALTGG